MPLFTIVTVTWNAQDVIAPTLQSVREQTCTDFEYLIIDGASSDNTLELIRQANIAGTRLYSEPDRGLYDAMNKAIDRAEGEYLIWLNAGDAFATPDTLARVAEHAGRNPVVIYGQTQIVDANRNVIGPRHLTAPATLKAEDFRRGMLVCHQAFIARSDSVPHYDLQYRFSADYDWCVKVLRFSNGRNAYVGDQPIISYLDGGLTNKNHRRSLAERFRIMCHHFGAFSTIVHHIGFLPRYLSRKIKSR